MQQTMTDYPTANSYGLKEGEVSTGTTIVALPFAGGVVVGADSRVSTGSYVANRVSDKIVALSEHIFAARSGSAADTQTITDYIRYFLNSLAYVQNESSYCVRWESSMFLTRCNHHLTLNISRIETGRPVRVKTAAHLMQRLVYENKDSLSAGLIVAGWDPVEGASIYSIPMGGTCLKVPFAMSGSGSTYIYGLMDAEYRENMTQEEARTLAKKGLAHAMARDGSSGGIIRTVVVTSEGSHRDYTPGNQLPFGPVGY
jgi:20S proteasome subunit beta 1